METKIKYRVIEIQTSFITRFHYGSHHFLVISYGNRVMSYGNQKSKHPFTIEAVPRSRYLSLNFINLNGAFQLRIMDMDIDTDMTWVMVT